MLKVWWAHQDSNLEPDRYEQVVSWRNPRNSAKKPTFVWGFAQPVPCVFSGAGFAVPKAQLFF